MEHTSNPTTIVYANDPLCGWCFATGPQISAARRALSDEFAWRVECGGLVVGERVRAIAHDRDYLLAGLRRVGEVSGRVVGSRYLSDVLDIGTWVSDSEPACRAVLVVQDLYGHAAIDYAHALSDALYIEGRTPDRASTVRDVATSLGLDANEVESRWAHPDTRAMVTTRFARARNAGIRTYPSVFVESGGRLIEVSSGYATAQQIIERVIDVAGTASAR